MIEWFKRRGQRPKRLAELDADELDAMLAEHPGLEALLRHSLGIMQFAPSRVAERVLGRVEAIIDETLQRRLSPDQEQDFVLRELETLRHDLATGLDDQAS